MQHAVFNIHDVVLLMTAILCTFFATLLLITNPPKNVSNFFLAAFLLMHACIPLNELVLWGAYFKLYIRSTAPELNFMFGFAYYVDAALLYFYIKSLVFKDFQLHRKDALHLIPLAGYGLFMYVAFYALPSSVKLDWVNNEVFAYSRGYVSLEFLCRLSRVGYCVAALLMIVRYKDILRATRSNIGQVDLFWLNLLVIGFLIVASLDALLNFFKMVGVLFHYEFQHARFNIYEMIGLTSYYALFALVSTLVFTSIRYFSAFVTVKHKDKELLVKPTQENLINPQLADKIDLIMREKKPHLQNDITIDLLGETLDIPSRDLSILINRHFQKNFWEFINYYRIEEAKRYLSDKKYDNKSITDIYLEVGFNSKSVFNTFFKKLVGVTPSVYRLNAQDEKSDAELHAETKVS